MFYRFDNVEKGFGSSATRSGLLSNHLEKVVSMEIRGLSAASLSLLAAPPPTTTLQKTEARQLLVDDCPGLRCIPNCLPTGHRVPSTCSFSICSLVPGCSHASKARSWILCPGILMWVFLFHLSHSFSLIKFSLTCLQEAPEAQGKLYSQLWGLLPAFWRGAVGQCMGSWFDAGFVHLPSR